MKNKFDKYFSAPQKSDLVVKRVAVHTEDTFFDICNRYIPQAVIQTKALSKEYFRLNNLSAHADIRQILLGVYTFVRFNIRYKLDRKGYEQIRLPRQIWADGVGDCEDFVILCSSLLINLGIAHTVRMADYGNGWQHIYIKVGNIILDPVDSKFNHEDKGKYKDFKIVPAKMLAAKMWNTPKNKGLGRIGIDAEKARIEGKFVDGGNTYVRQPYITEQLIKGRDCDISFSLDVEAKGYYALIPADFLQPSHLGKVENPLHFIPDAQPRNRAMSQSGANTPRLIAEKLRPAEICEGSTAYSGTPIINERGEVIQGNGRAYTMKVYWDEFQTDPREYINYLAKNKLAFGLDNFKVENNPVLVRVIPCTDQEAIKLGQYKQADLEAVATRSNDIKSKISLIDDKTVQDILRNVFPENDDQESTLTELIRKSSVASLLIKRNIYRSDEFVENFVNQRTNELNADGVRQITDLIVGLIFKGSDTNTPELFRQLPDRIQTGIAKSAKYILDASPENNISKEIGKSIRGVVNYNNSGFSFKEWTVQTSMFSGLPTDEYSPLQLAIIKLLADSGTQKEIIAAFKKYHTLTHNEVKNGFDFDNKPLRLAVSKAQALKEVFGVVEKEVVEPKQIISKELQKKADEASKTISQDNDINIQRNKFLNQLANDFYKKVKHTRISIEKLALKFGIENKNHVKELNELAIVRHCRTIVKNLFLTERQKYNQIVEFYQSQANSSHRTSESIMFQQYSTPSPIAYLMGKFCKIDKPYVGANEGIKPHQFYEPSAGNGILTIVAEDELLFDVNEISEFRNSNLKLEGYGNVSKYDASIKDKYLDKYYNAVLTNPPFASLDKPVLVDGYKITALDHIMAIYALDCMKDHGRAAIIIGGNTEWDKEGRIQSGKNRIFINYLYSHYEVADILNLDGSKLYSRQGTSFNVRLILIEGRKKVVEGYAPLFDPVSDVQIRDFDTLFNRVDPLINTQKVEVDKNSKLALKYKYKLKMIAILKIKELQNVK